MPANNSLLSRQRALRIWPRLIEAASEERTFTYAELSEIIFSHVAAQSVSRPLNVLLAFCRKQGLPPLPILVVSKRTRKPSAGKDVYPDVQQETRNVYDYKDWAHVPVPTLTDLA